MLALFPLFALCASPSPLPEVLIAHSAALSERSQFVPSQLRRWGQDQKWQMESGGAAELMRGSGRVNMDKICNTQQSYTADRAFSPHDIRSMNASDNVAEWSLLFKHVQMWKRVEAAKRPMLVVEDDAEFADGFPTKLQSSLAELGDQQFDILWPGYCCCAPDGDQVSANVGKHSGTGCTHSYLLSPAGATKLLASLPLHHCLPADHAMNVLIGKWSKSWKGFALEQSLVNQSSRWSSSIRPNEVVEAQKEGSLAAMLETDNNDIGSDLLPLAEELGRSLEALQDSERGDDEKKEQDDSTQQVEGDEAGEEQGSVKEEVESDDDIMQEVEQEQAPAQQDPVIPAKKEEPPPPEPAAEEPQQPVQQPPPAPVQQVVYVGTPPPNKLDEKTDELATVGDSLDKTDEDLNELINSPPGPATEVKGSDRTKKSDKKQEEEEE